MGIQVGRKSPEELNSDLIQRSSEVTHLTYQEMKDLQVRVGALAIKLGQLEGAVEGRWNRTDDGLKTITRMIKDTVTRVEDLHHEKMNALNRWYIYCVLSFVIGAALMMAVTHV